MSKVWHKNTVVGKLCSEQVIMKYTLQNSEKKFQKYEKKVQKSCQTSFWPVLMLVVVLCLVRTETEFLHRLLPYYEVSPDCHVHGGIHSVAPKGPTPRPIVS